MIVIHYNMCGCNDILTYTHYSLLGNLEIQLRAPIVEDPFKRQLSW